MKPKILMIADVRGWIFERHAHHIARGLADKFEFSIQYRDEPFDEGEYDLIYPLEWNLLPKGSIRSPQKYVTGIRSYISWEHQDFWWLIDYLSTNFQSIHCVSERLTKLFSRFITNVSYVTHGVDTQLFKPQRQICKSPAGTIIIGWAGNRINKTKGFEEMIAPLQTIPGVSLNFCGFIDKNLSLSEMVAFYNSIDCYVCASAEHKEGNNNSLLEAAAMERAIITTDNGTVPEYLKHGVNAFILDRDLPSFISAVIELRDHVKIRQDFGKFAREQVIQKFDWASKLSSYDRFFYNALENVSSWAPCENKSLRVALGSQEPPKAIIIKVDEQAPMKDIVSIFIAHRRALDRDKRLKLFIRTAERGSRLSEIQRQLEAVSVQINIKKLSETELGLTSPEHTGSLTIELADLTVPSKYSRASILGLHDLMEDYEFIRNTF